MASVVQGIKYLLEAFKADDYYPFACAMGARITRTNEYDSTVEPDSGIFRTRKPSGLSDLAIEFTGVTVLQDAVTKWFGWEFLTDQMREGVNLRLTVKDDEGNFKEFTGFFYPQTTTLEGIAGDTGNDSITFVLGGGPVGIGDGGITPPVNAAFVKRIDFTIVDGQAWVSDPFLVGKTKTQILEVSREDSDKWKVIDSGIPDERQVLLDGVGGKLTFIVPLEAGEAVFALVSYI